MKRTVELREGSKEKRSFLFRPRDPVWTSTPHMDDVRVRLAQFDQRVTVWWGANRGRWQLMEWSQNNGSWRRICFWEGPKGEFRSADADAMLHKLGTMCFDAKKMLASIDAHNEKVDRNKGREFREANYEYLKDIYARAMGVRQTFAPGMIRSRKWLAGEAGGNHRRFISQHLTREWEARNGRRWEG
jgi:hypothetical protein